MNHTLSESQASPMDEIGPELLTGPQSYLSHVPSILSAIVVTLYMGWWVNAMLNRSKLPPGPWRLPIVGSLAFHGIQAPDLLKLKKKYGDIYTIFVGGNPLVVCTSKKVIKEAMDTKGQDFSGRGNGWLTMAITGKKGGFAGSDYTPQFRQTRDRTLHILHTLGYGRPDMEKHMQTEIGRLVEHMRDFCGNKGGDFDPDSMVMVSQFNIMNGVVCGETFGFDDELAIRTCRAIRDIYGQPNAPLCEVFPSLRFVPPMSNEVKLIMDSVDILMLFIRGRLREHLANHKAGNDSDFLHMYIDKHLMDGMKEDSDDFKAEVANLENLFRDFNLVGVEVASTSIKWLLVMLVNYPEVQERAFAEVKEHVGLGRDVCMADKNKLNYIQALIWELQRYRPLLPFGLPKFAERENTLAGYTIPQGTQLMCPLEAEHFNKEAWGDPDVFRPERFLDEVTGKFVDPPHYTPFFVGKRACFGEAMARQMLFLYTATLVQKFQFLPPTSGKNDKVDEKGVYAFTLQPKAFDMRVLLR